MESVIDNVMIIIERRSRLRAAQQGLLDVTRAAARRMGVALLAGVAVTLVVGVVAEERLGVDVERLRVSSRKEGGRGRGRGEGRGARASGNAH